MIEGNLVRLWAVERSDLVKLQEWLNDPEVTEGFTHFLPLSIEDEEKWYAALANEAPEQRPLAIEVRGEEGWQLAGNTGCPTLSGFTGAQNSALTLETRLCGIGDTVLKHWSLCWNMGSTHST